MTQSTCTSGPPGMYPFLGMDSLNSSVDLNISNFLQFVVANVCYKHIDAYNLVSPSNVFLRKEKC